MTLKRNTLLAIGLTLLIASAWIATTVRVTRADPPASPTFQRTWERTDKPVQDIAVSRTWMWGPDAFTGMIQEDYADAPGSARDVQYFDKSRMEDNAYRASEPWDVTNGLLVVELMTGRMQVGDSSFQNKSPAAINVGGDADDPTGPTYATMALVRDAPPLPDGQPIEWTLDRDGNVGQAPPISTSAPVFAETYVPETNHRVASVFWTFMNSSGLVWQNDALATDQLFLNPYYATGFPITEAYWSEIKVAGTYQWVLLQCFERRCLTYTPGNQPGWQVEAGNVGQHYYAWRYPQQPPTATPTATQPGAPTSTPTATTTPTATATTPASPTATVTATATQPPTAPSYQFSTTFGEAWDPTTLMNTPRGIARLGNDIYVADTNNHRIQKYTYDGEFLVQWGSQGTGNGQFNQPVGVAVDSNGVVYVADRGNARVQIFDSVGNWLQTVTTVDPGGAILHTFQTLEDIDVGGGLVWVVDSGRQQLLGFPTFFGSGKGYLSPANLTLPTGVAFDPGNNVIWVTNAGPGFTDMKRYDLQANYEATTTVPGTTFLADAMVDSVGSLWVVDSLASTFHKWHTVGGWVQEFSAQGTALGQFNGPSSLTPGYGGELFVADSDNNRIQRVSTIGFPVSVWSDNRRGRYLLPSGIQWYGNIGIYVVDTGLSRIQLIDYNGDYLDDWGAGTTVPPGDPALFLPLDIAADDFGNIFVADTFNNRIVKYGGAGFFVQEWGTAGSGPGQFSGPLSIEVDSAGNVYVADGLNHRIQKFDTVGNYITEWGSQGSAPGSLNTPSGLAIAGNDLFVVDQGNHRVQRFDLNGVFSGIWWGSFGSNPGQFNVPADIEVGPDGNVYVADSQNHRVQAFTTDGQFLDQWGSGPGNGPQQFNVPIDISFDVLSGIMYVTDRENNRIQVLTIM